MQKYSREIYARASEALHCRVHATLMLPLFTAVQRRNPVGVLEVVQVSVEQICALQLQCVLPLMHLVLHRINNGPKLLDSSDQLWTGKLLPVAIAVTATVLHADGGGHALHAAGQHRVHCPAGEAGSRTCIFGQGMTSMSPHRITASCLKSKAQLVNALK